MGGGLRWRLGPQAQAWLCPWLSWPAVEREWAWDGAKAVSIGGPHSSRTVFLYSCRHCDNSRHFAAEHLSICIVLCCHGDCFPRSPAATGVEHPTFRSISQLADTSAGQERPRNGLFCTEWDVRFSLIQSIDQPSIPYITGRLCHIAITFGCRMYPTEVRGPTQAACCKPHFEYYTSTKNYCRFIFGFRPLSAPPKSPYMRWTVCMRHWRGCNIRDMTGRRWWSTSHWVAQKFLGILSVGLRRKVVAYVLSPAASRHADWKKRVQRLTTRKKPSYLDFEKRKKI